MYQVIACNKGTRIPRPGASVHPVLYDTKRAAEETAVNLNDAYPFLTWQVFKREEE